MKKITFLVLVFFSITLIQAQVPQSERDALIALYNATDGPNWSYSYNWNTSNPVSTWYGITVNNINGQDHVTEISLWHKNLTGSLPAEIGDFPELTSLNLIGNNLSGNLPTSLSNLIQLNFLHLDNNHFSGLFPDVSNTLVLHKVNIRNNDFQLADLEPTYAAIKTRCEANGGWYYYSPMNPVDTELSIDMVNGNNYTFNMPTISGTNVTYQWYKNDVSIPGATSQTYNITNAQYSDLGDYTCKAQGSIIPDLTIDRNVIHLYGTVDAGDKAALLALYNATDGNNWTYHTNWNSTQPVYTWYGIEMQGNRVSEINLFTNNLNGSLPSEIGDLTNLKELGLDFNHLSGTIPPEIGNLTQLKYLNFWVNDLTGNIPAEMGNLINLEWISLEENELSGNMPSSLANLTKIQAFWVNGNQLSGDIPDIFQNWTDLKWFSLGYYDEYSNHNLHNSFTGDLNLSQNQNLSWITIQNQSLSSVDLRNGNNNFVSLLLAQNNPNLTCIFVDDAAYSTANWTNIDPNTHFVETQAECDALYTPEFDQDLIALYPNPVNDVVYIQNNGLDIKSIEVQNMTGQTVINSNEQTQIDLSSLSAGMYLIKITDQNDKIGVYKVVKK